MYMIKSIPQKDRIYQLKVAREKSEMTQSWLRMNI